MELNRSNIKKIIFIIAVAAVIFTAAENFEKTAELFGTAYGVISPLVLGFCIAFVLNTFMVIIEEKILKNWKKKPKLKGLIRPVSILLSIAFAFSVFLIVLLVVLPEIVELFRNLAATVPGMIEDLWEKMVIWLENTGINADVLSKVSIDWEQTGKELFQSLVKGSETVLTGALGVLGGIISVSTNFLMGLVTAIYGLAQKEKIMSFTKRLMAATLPKRAAQRVQKVATLSSKVFSKFIIGQMTEAVVLGTLCLAGMTLFRFPYAVVISMFIAVTALIPVVGAFIGGAVGAVLILSVSPLKALLFVVFLVVLQQLEGNLIYPRVVGKSVGLPGIVVFSAIIIGGNAGGVLGALLSVPTAAVIFILTKEFVDKKTKKTVKESDA